MNNGVKKGHIISYCRLVYHIISYYVISCHSISYHIILYHNYIRILNQLLLVPCYLHFLFCVYFILESYLRFNNFVFIDSQHSLLKFYPTQSTQFFYEVTRTTFLVCSWHCLVKRKARQCRSKSQEFF